MKRFAVVGHRAATSGTFSLNDLPGSAGRMDILCRCINSSFFLSHDLRRDVECYLILCGEPDPPKTILFRGSEVRYLSPDERSSAALIKKALSIPCGDEFRESTPGVYVRRGGLSRLLSGIPFAVLDEAGEDIRRAPALPEAYLLSDHQEFTPEEQEMLEGRDRYSVGPLSLHADHTITILLNEMDRRESGWISLKR
ncbi:MAG TPA: tRNA (pseudouridine(54)-N(1))-methyltransferase TrmY [Candidatus Methanoculleus thermohydrogenotrophicum]|jgi:tRNA (pseudouridine54-N1)-methyltransferase|nr:tRNA (pseudouridine(54)-N(1))-methyltransferase TrmY [Candidatus Methanoculleus thermohydrogenotrophicum]NLM82648.1 tRNA (pseudouridine(54)-N(1))-methyltransferase TrmY [Candidatus Methanoculleus thermohydrogenotrophicum]HOB18222.1 tRNA (pseudouridine(54)-N(1))-methyltransferase TrmY [Candidatus Methanoculleus thermohydrogenotrophicum]HPZ37863.1 tRNA (pseudouridine(54)-N(1))-methyltransferase TrmY [Candidatus Methanoculleus thermohydrogenotrophicum]HQC91089.1 tRNA (pseudouridine(54)-N(1))-me